MTKGFPKGASDPLDVDRPMYAAPVEVGLETSRTRCPVACSHWSQAAIGCVSGVTRVAVAAGVVLLTVAEAAAVAASPAATASATAVRAEAAVAAAWAAAEASEAVVGAVLRGQ